MWKNSFVATAIALGDNVDGALAAIGPASASSLAMHALVAGLRATQRPQRAQALATALRDVATALDEITLR